MNVFKILSRSSKPSQNASTLKLPSSGAALNPQLFGHNELEKQLEETKGSRKRKRGHGTVESSIILPAALDFFTSVPKAQEAENIAGAGRKKCKRKKRSEDGNEEQDEISHAQTDENNEDENKRILRSHKLKIMVLENFMPQVEETKPDKKKKKKRKKEKAEKSDKKKESKEQLFPQPLTSFAQLRPRYGISRRLEENLQEQAYTMPTEVQLGALPLLLGSKKGDAPEFKESTDGATSAKYGGEIDLLTVAPTGSGKTIAFLIPVIHALLSERTESAEEGPKAVVIAPTRELASQIVNEARKLSKGTGIKATLVKKGMEVVERSPDEVSDDEEDSASESDSSGQAVRQKIRTRRRSEKVKAAIIVATPLALLNALKRTNGTVAELPTIRHVVLDEADVLLDPLFREQTLAIWNACTNPLLRVGLWSATMGSNIEALAVNTLNERWASLAGASLPPRPPLIRLVVGLKDSAVPNIAHQLTYAATEQGKLLGLRQLLHPTAAPASSNDAPSLRPPFLVFTQTIPRAIALHSELLYDIPPEAGGSSRIAVLHADLSSSARESIMTRFRRGEIWVLITTDLLARGVDFRGLNGVVNYDVPNSAAAYVHRVGRTGRAGRQGGVAVTFYTQEDIPYIKLIANIIRASEKLRGKGEDDLSVKQWLLDALPTPTKREKQSLKKWGVEARRNVKDKEGKVKRKARISTKSGYDRKMENRRRGAILGSRNKAGMEKREEERVESESEFEGFGE
jgi:ATP-dependent RNA helicase DDX52/ROK1